MGGPPSVWDVGFRGLGSGVRTEGVLNMGRSKMLHFLQCMANSRDPNNPMQVIFADFGAQCRDYLHTWIPRVMREGKKPMILDAQTLNPNGSNRPTGTTIASARHVERVWRVVELYLRAFERYSPA